MRMHKSWKDPQVKVFSHGGVRSGPVQVKTVILSLIPAHSHRPSQKGRGTEYITTTRLDQPNPTKNGETSQNLRSTKAALELELDSLALTATADRLRCRYAVGHYIPSLLPPCCRLYAVISRRDSVPRRLCEQQSGTTLRLCHFV